MYYNLQQLTNAKTLNIWHVYQRVKSIFCFTAVLLFPHVLFLQLFSTSSTSPVTQPRKIPGKTGDFKINFAKLKTHSSLDAVERTSWEMQIFRNLGSKAKMVSAKLERWIVRHAGKILFNTINCMRNPKHPSSYITSFFVFPSPLLSSLHFYLLINWIWIRIPKRN